MGESVQYLAIDLAELEAVLRGTDGTVKPAIRVLLRDVKDERAKKVLESMYAGNALIWDEEPLRSAPWETYRDVSGNIASVCRLLGRKVGFDAWPDGLRMQFKFADWAPLPHDFGLKICCRPFAPVRFDRFPDGRLSDYVESFPHGYVHRSEFPTVIPALHRILRELYDRHRVERESGDSQDGDPKDGGRQGDKDSNPLDRLGPGVGFPDDRIVDIMTLDATTLHGWQIGRCAIVYDALCRAKAMDRDLVAVGY